ncbi:MAG: alpha/beta hydrolase [Aestuariivita sp.]|nr:alpha/beta hydrolase [Aestuariivita sp.]
MGDATTDTRYLVDPELLSGLELFPIFNENFAALEEFRALLEESAFPESAYAQEDVLIERQDIEGPDGRVGIVILRPKEQTNPLPVYLHLHPGGLIFGTAEQSNPSNVVTVSAVGCVIVSVDYRLAPEAKGPGALMDCYAVLQWLYENASDLWINPEKIAVGGESAGGGLAAALTQYARDQGKYPICFQLLLAPMLDDRSFFDRHLQPPTGEFIWTRSSNRYAWSCYLGQETCETDIPAYTVPARMTDLSNLPKAYIQVGALDLFLTECVDYATRLLAAKCAVELHIFPGAYHGFQRVKQARVSARAMDEAHLALKIAFGD